MNLPAPALGAVTNRRMERNQPDLSRAATFRTEWAPQTTSQNALTLVRTFGVHGVSRTGGVFLPV